MASVEQVQARIALVGEHLRTAHQQLTEACERLAEAHAILTEASRMHPRSLVPPELTKACDHAGEQLTLLLGVMEAVERFSSRL
ncbi:hypothetical protein [Kutzneria sp. NPDC052558]|uniref:hypothetical protein n=1 Tax=Kutzneria sp. NPDC052558 TaxID=3364121 RepID=UPI0037C9F055